MPFEDDIKGLNGYVVLRTIRAREGDNSPVGVAVAVYPVPDKDILPGDQVLFFWEDNDFIVLGITDSYDYIALLETSIIARVRSTKEDG